MVFFSLVPRRARPRKTVEDFMRLPEGVRAELIEGELIMSPSPKTPHQWVVMNLATTLAQFVHPRKLGRVFSAPYDVHLPSGDVVEPDVLYIAQSNLTIVKDWVRGVPDLVVEVLSPDGIARDRLVKRDLYARNGVREYWIVDTEERTIEVFTLHRDEYEPWGYFGANDVLESSLLADFSLPLAEVFNW